MKNCIKSDTHRVHVLHPVFPAGPDGVAVEPEPDAPLTLIEIVLTVSAADAAAMHALPDADEVPSGVQVVDRMSRKVWGVSRFSHLGGLIAVALPDNDDA